jgi:membrane-associated protease RseP (regulator of RpoE activity)
MRLKAILLALLLVATTASRVAASGNPSPTPDQDVEDKTKEKTKKEKKIVIKVPDQEIVLDGDDMFLEGEDGPEMLADLGDFGDLEQRLSWLDGGGYIGVRPIEMTPDLRVHFGAPREAGVLVGTVEKDSPAAKAGLQVGDIVTAADGQKVERRRDLVRAIRHKKEGDTVQIDIVRDRATKTLSVAVAEREDGRVRIGQIGEGMQRFPFRHHRIPPVPPVPPSPRMAPVPPAPPVPPGIQNQLDDLQKRLDALESRVPQKQGF